MKLFHEDPEYIIKSFHRFIRKGELKRAYHCLEKLIKLYPCDIKLLAEIVILCMERKEHKLAKYWLLKKMEIEKDWQDYLCLAPVEAEIGNIARAKEYLITAEKLKKQKKQEAFDNRYSLEPISNIRSFIYFREIELERKTQEAKVKYNIEKVNKEEKIIPQKKTFLPKKQTIPEASLSVIVPIPSYDIKVKYLPSTDNISDYFNLPSTIHDCRFLIEYFELKNQQSYDELLCLKNITGVEHYWYQVETARKVLKYFHGRAILADEVGLGKTIEAGMLIKEYLLRGMIKNVLILTPVSLVSQWKEEMFSKFGLNFITTEDEDVKVNSKDFWTHSLIIASIHTAKSSNNFTLVVADKFYDLVVVDEAHHLRNKNTLSWKLVNQIQKRFILLLTATPVQNNLIELFNLITLLRPGQLQTEKIFKKEYLKRGTHQMEIINKDKLRTLLREVMIRNTRSNIDLKLPKRFATTVLADPGELEKKIIEKAYSLIRRQDFHSHIRKPHLTMLLTQIGSCPYALYSSISKINGISAEIKREIEEITHSITTLEDTGKGRVLLELLTKNPGEKKVIFTYYLKTMDYISGLLEKAGFSFVQFRGDMKASEKDKAIASFQNSQNGTNILLSSESGGEGRNMQFCNTLINFDLPWNPMRIEQRIGRLHRIGQTRDVFIFNLTVKDTIEEQIINVLENKINMFELVIGEIEPILGYLSEEKEFEDIILDIWLRSSDAQGIKNGFNELGENMVKAKQEYIKSRELDNKIFREDYEV